MAPLRVGSSSARTWLGLGLGLRLGLGLASGLGLGLGQQQRAHRGVEAEAVESRLELERALQPTVYHAVRLERLGEEGEQG